MVSRLGSIRVTAYRENLRKEIKRRLNVDAPEIVTEVPEKSLKGKRIDHSIQSVKNNLKSFSTDFWKARSRGPSV